MKLKQLILQAADKIENNKVLQAVRSGIVLSIPAVMAGSVALLLLSFPLKGYQHVLHTLFNGFFFHFFTIVHSCTLEIISLIFLISISYSFEKAYHLPYKGILPFVNLCAYLAFSWIPDKVLTLEIFKSVMLFSVLIVTLVSSCLFLLGVRLVSRKILHVREGADSQFFYSLQMALPALGIIVIFALINLAVNGVFGVNNVSQGLAGLMNWLFASLGRTLGSGLLFLFMLHFLWFFGVHGGNVLDEVGRSLFASGIDVNINAVASGQVPTEIISKTFLDTFALFGGCGAILCLIAAILLIEKRRSMRNISKLAFAPALFNMNEMILFGIPIVLNPVYLIPFVTVPMVLTVISYLAIVCGLVPVPVHVVEWTTPIFFSGYAATGSVAGSVLQLVNLAVGTVIYLPFVKLSMALDEQRRRGRVQALTEQVKQQEHLGKKTALLQGEDHLADAARLLADEFREALYMGTAKMYYQPQVDECGQVSGVETLLRWEYGDCGFVYPVLLVSLAREAGFLDLLSSFVIEQSLSSLKTLQEKWDKPIKVSMNFTPEQLSDGLLLDGVKAKIKEYGVDPALVGIEVTEQTVFQITALMAEQVESLRNMGVRMVMDDFGMGHSSMMYLQRHAFDEVKLDGSLVKDIQTNERSLNIISSIMQLSQTLNFQVVAEFVENREQMEALKGLGCRLYQGYLFSKALPFDQFLTYLEETNK